MSAFYESFIDEIAKIAKTIECPEGEEWDSRTKKCVSCPGGKIRSGGGRGPVGIPIGTK